jgi:hypothetical protein
VTPWLTPIPRSLLYWAAAAALLGGGIVSAFMVDHVNREEGVRWALETLVVSCTLGVVLAIEVAAVPGHYMPDVNMLLPTGIAGLAFIALDVILIALVGTLS